MKARRLIFLFVVLFAFLPALAPSIALSLPKKHTIYFGGALGFHYSPDNLEVIVGDTIEWSGNFTKFGLESVSVPSGSPSFKADSVPTFQYVVRKQGLYTYRNPVYFSIGMQGIILVDSIKHGLTNEGREFYLGMLYPNYVYSHTGGLNAFFSVNAMITSYYENEIHISYYDDLGHEKTPSIYHISAQGSLRIPLDISAMFMDTTSEHSAYRACHIVSASPITIEYLSIGASSGGSYLALPVVSLGKNYVVASYNDNPGEGSISPAASTYSAGEFLIIATEDNTNVRITPTSTTIGGHPGIFTGIGANGKPQPYSIQLNKAQTYLVRSNGNDNSTDLSGSLVESNNAIAVISGHENAVLGGTGTYPYEARDFMIEQMVPYELWDSTGYISIPFAESKVLGDEGHGDTYRIFSFDTVNYNTHLNVTGFGGYDFSTRRFSVPELHDVTGSMEASSTGGHKFSVMQYDERSHSSQPPYPAPSMMTIVPKSRWKKFFAFNILNNISLTHTFDFEFINVLSSHLEAINILISGQTSVPLSSLSRNQLFSGISATDNSLSGIQYKLPTPLFSEPPSCFLYSEYPFMVYFYEMRYVTSQNEPIPFCHEYAAPAGMQLNTGVAPSFSITIDSSNCTSWHFCVTDTSKTDPGIKSVMLIDDPDGVYFEPGEQLKNVSFDTLLTYLPNELRPQGVKQYCFDVNILTPLQDAIAPVAIVDNGGNAVLINLFKSAPPLKLSTTPTSLRPDSIVFPVKKIGDQICTTFVLKNSAKIGGTAITLNSALLTNKDTSYKVVSITPSLPHSIAAQDSVNVQVCYTAADSSRHRDSLIMQTDCFSIAISLDAHGSTGLINASDLDFGSITIGDTLCKNLQIKNVGTAPFTLTKSFILSDNINFSVDTTHLPVVIQPNGSVQINICFHPNQEGPISSGIDWSSDLESSFAHSIKSHSVLSGNATPKAGVKTSATSQSFSIHPNPANDRIIVSFSGTDFSPFRRTEVHPTAGVSLSMFDVLGREVYKQDILSGVSQVEVPVRGLSEGVYFVQLNSGSGSITQRFMKVK